MTTRRSLSPALPFALLAIMPLAAGCSDEGGDETNSWEGRSYLLEIPAVNWSEPRGVGDEIGDFVPDFVISVEGSTNGGYSLTMGTAFNGQQDTCNSTTEIVGRSPAYPNVEIGPFEFPIFVRHVDKDIAVPATIYGLTLSNVLPGDTPATEGELHAVMDFREVYSLFTQLGAPTPDSVCEALGDALSGAMCSGCPSDDMPYCLSLSAIELGATEDASLSLEPMAPSEVDPGCVRP